MYLFSPVNPVSVIPNDRSGAEEVVSMRGSLPHTPYAKPSRSQESLLPRNDMFFTDQVARKGASFEHGDLAKSGIWQRHGSAHVGPGRDCFPLTTSSAKPAALLRRRCWNDIDWVG